MQGKPRSRKGTAGHSESHGVTYVSLGTGDWRTGARTSHAYRPDARWPRKNGKWPVSIEVVFALAIAWCAVRLWGYSPSRFRSPASSPRSLLDRLVRVASEFPPFYFIFARVYGHMTTTAMHGNEYPRTPFTLLFWTVYGISDRAGAERD